MQARTNIRSARAGSTTLSHHGVAYRGRWYARSTTRTWTPAGGCLSQPGSSDGGPTAPPTTATSTNSPYRTCAADTAASGTAWARTDSLDWNSTAPTPCSWSSTEAHGCGTYGAAGASPGASAGYQAHTSSSRLLISSGLRGSTRASSVQSNARRPTASGPVGGGRITTWSGRHVASPIPSTLAITPRPRAKMAQRRTRFQRRIILVYDQQHRATPNVALRQVSRSGYEPCDVRAARCAPPCCTKD